MLACSCSTVKTEIEARITRGYDRKSHPGHYDLVVSEEQCTKASRTTGDGAKPGPYTDLIGFDYTEVTGHPTQMCRVVACSESQVSSKCDFSTNFCNMYNLFCPASDGCTPLAVDIGKNLTWTDGASCNHGFQCGGQEADTTQCTR